MTDAAVGSESSRSRCTTSSGNLLQPATSTYRPGVRRHRLQGRRQGHAHRAQDRQRQQGLAERLLPVGDAGQHRRATTTEDGSPVQHRHDADRRARSARSPATWRARPSQGIERPDRPGSGRALGHRCNCVKGSSYGISPRIRPIPLYDPVYYEDGKQTGRNADFKMVSFLGVFVVGMQGNDVIGTRASDQRRNARQAPPRRASSFAQAIRLVK